ncbi:T9SS type A sorting domain-containing protein [Dyadobacter sediminis]|uniref:T9SS type A sorting domain-containing protein n=1 Tax=Dyadobacter sediminis TaxID=1493691 RepID=A0A5R9K5V6_9BACT|nr:T9SS type A sorting domain-containing protein [Dyadobacter sediminis]TLU89041.1 T9SS type A sorting domain-containing protein [Dyadobacter sediminis]GGC03299.1 hypothetical protein GCM10011325_32950 [Dyadobacter sediminis]
MNFTRTKVVVFFILLVTYADHTFAQRAYSVIFDRLPRDFQLYARDDSSYAEVPISGMIEIPGWDYISVVTYRNKERFAYTKDSLRYNGKTTTTFELLPVIKAEMADYDFEVYARNGKDSMQLIKRTDIVAGDFFVVSGQSNGAATVFGDWSNKYCRTIARVPDGSPAITPADTLWIQSGWSWTYVGAWEIQLQRMILEEEGIPTCIINGCLPGKKISEFLQRDNANPANQNTLYGSLLYRVNVAKPSRIRAFVWMHGEQEVFEYIPNYATQYDQLYKYWDKDYPAVEKFLVMQSNVIVLNHENTTPVGGQIRDFLRRTKYIYPKTDHFTPIGVPGYDGVHYSKAGYEEIGRRLFAFLRPSLYYSTDTSNVSCPDIINARFTKESRNEIILTFDEGQELKWAADTVITGQNGQPLTLSLKDFFYLDRDETQQQILSGRVEGNEVILTLKESSNATKISYLPNFFPKNLPEPGGLKIGFLSGPFLRNKRGLGAFSFYDVAIDSPPVLGVEPNKKELFWQVYPNPASNLLTVNFEQPATGQLNIYNIKGQRYYASRLKAEKNFALNIAMWPAGTYILELQNSAGEVITQKIVKQ